mmetsp:Transcript_61835/g.135848  ORF Transcript_61835/g.135848 Transcript_61835/m.135848 type:complete len:96 (+) Transcript_61835:283-570(+)
MSDTVSCKHMAPTITITRTFLVMRHIVVLTGPVYLLSSAPARRLVKFRMPTATIQGAQRMTSELGGKITSDAPKAMLSRRTPTRSTKQLGDKIKT